MKRITAILLCLILCAAVSLSLRAASDADEGAYTDVPEGAWYAAAVKALREQGLMNGVSQDRFDPRGVFTRAQLATVLWRMAGSPAVQGEDAFSDTEPGTWYADAVLWASQNEIVNGYGDGKFGTNDPTTQEQLAVMLWRSAGSYVLGADYYDADGVENQASDYAVDAVRWARVDDLLTDAIAFEPKQPALRAQVADMVCRHLLLLERFSDADAVSSATRDNAENGNGETKMMENEIPEIMQPRCVLVIEANEKRFYASPEDNTSAKALMEKLNSGELTVDMKDYGGFEKVGDLPWELPKNDTQITTRPGDVILYQGNKITIYYDENSWNVTRLARIGSVTKEDLLTALGEGTVRVKFWLEWNE